MPIAAYHCRIAEAHAAPALRITVITLALVLSAGCGPKRDAYDWYSQAGARAESNQSGADAEAYYVSALHRARTTLGRQEQSDALYKLGAFYRRSARFQEAARALTESLDLAADARITDTLAIGRRRVELARALAALNRWGEGAVALRTVVPDVGRYPPEEADEIRELLAVYRSRLTALGSGSSDLAE
jgi:tetratricopeptide (TPR) repeat protein